MQDRAVKLAPTTIGALLEEKFTEDELKQVVSIMESPVYAKFQRMGDDMQKVLVDKVVADTRGTIEPKVRALEQTVAKRLGVTGHRAAAAPRPRARQAGEQVARLASLPQEAADVVGVGSDRLDGVAQFLFAAMQPPGPVAPLPLVLQAHQELVVAVPALSSDIQPPEMPRVGMAGHGGRRTHGSVRNAAAWA